MTGRLARRTEAVAERAACAVFAGACGFAGYDFGVDWVGRPVLGAIVAIGAVAAYLSCVKLLSIFADRPPAYEIALFAPCAFEVNGADELLLSDADRYHGELILTDTDRVRDELLLTAADRVSPSSPDDPLILDDIIDALGPDARVVRLFDRHAMPSPADLKSRIDRHAQAKNRPQDASQELSQALADLRKALR